MLTLHLLRHAKTNANSDSGLDFDRLLLEKGIRQSKMMAQFFKMNDFQPKFIFCSSAKRTRATLKEIQKLHALEHAVEFRKELYLASRRDLLSFLCEVKGNGDVFIIGHNNGLSDLITYLVDDFYDLPTCSFVSITFDVDDWSEVSQSLGKVAVYFSPKEEG